MTAVSYPNLFAPLTIGGATIRNRILSTGHDTAMGHDGKITDRLVAYQEARARGGAGLIVVQVAGIHHTALYTPHVLMVHTDACIPGYARLADAVHRHGATIFGQLFHPGREVMEGKEGIIPPGYAPSAVPNSRFRTMPIPMTAALIADVVKGYGDAALRMQMAGLDGCEIVASHGYLPAQFLDPRANRRTDAYGGTRENRMRFIREIVTDIRAKTRPGFAVGIRISGDDKDTDALDPSEIVEICRRYDRDGGLDYFNVIAGTSATIQGAVHIVPPMALEAGYVAPFAAAVKAAVKVPVLVAGRINQPQIAETVIASGQADMCGMTRALIADPDLVAKARAGRPEDVIPCIGCNQGCIGHYHAGVPIACLANLRTGRERTLPARGAGARGSGDLLVIGAGPAGLTAAIEGAHAGRRVVLVERADAIGGQLRLAGRCPAHAELWRRYRATVERDIAGAGVELRLGTVADAELADGFAEVVLATGARPYAPPLPPLGDARAVQAWDAIADPDAVPADGRVLVLDWGGDWTGLDAAEALAVRGRDVVLATAASVAGETLHQYQRAAYLARLDRRGVELLPHRELADAGGEAALRNIYSGRLAPLPAGTATIVLAQGRVPDDALWAALEGRAGAVRAGDVLGPRSMEEAVLEGGEAVLGALRSPAAHV